MTTSFLYNQNNLNGAMGIGFSSIQENHDKLLTLLVAWLINRDCRVEFTGFERRYKGHSNFYEMCVTYSNLSYQEKKARPDLLVTLPNGKKFYLELKTGDFLEAFQCAFFIKSMTYGEPIDDLENHLIIYVVGKSLDDFYVLIPNMSFYKAIKSYYYRDYSPWLNADGLPHNWQFLEEQFNVYDLMRLLQKLPRADGKMYSNDPCVLPEENARNYYGNWQGWFMNEMGVKPQPTDVFWTEPTP